MVEYLQRAGNPKNWKLEAEALLEASHQGLAGVFHTPVRSHPKNSVDDQDHLSMTGSLQE